MTQPDQPQDQAEPKERVLGTGAKECVDDDPSKPAVLDSGQLDAEVAEFRAMEESRLTRLSGAPLVDGTDLASSNVPRGAPTATATLPVQPATTPPVQPATTTTPAPAGVDTDQKGNG